MSGDILSIKNTFMPKSKIKAFQVFDKSQATVIFASSKDYILTNGEFIDFDPSYLVFRSKQEHVLECKDRILLDKLIKLGKQQNTFFPQTKPLIEWLESEQITYYIATNTITV